MAVSLVTNASASPPEAGWLALRVGKLSDRVKPHIGLAAPVHRDANALHPDSAAAQVGGIKQDRIDHEGFGSIIGRELNADLGKC